MTTKKSPKRYKKVGGKHPMVLELTREEHEQLLALVERYRSAVGQAASKVFVVRQLIRHHFESGKLPEIIP